MIVRHSVRAEDAKEAVIYVGSPESVAGFEDSLSEEARSLYKVVARFDPSEGTVDEFRELLKEESVGRVIFAAKHTEFGILARSSNPRAAGRGGLDLGGVHPDAGGAPGLRPPGRQADAGAALDPGAVLGDVGEGGDGPPVGVAGHRADVLVVADCGDRHQALEPAGPVFFHQKRAGRYGKPFTMWKFRTMSVDAEDRLEEMKRREATR